MACRDPGSAKCAGTWTASMEGVMALSESYGISCSWRSEDLFGQSLSIAPPSQALRGLPCLGSFFVVGHIRRLKGHPGSYSVVQCSRGLMGQPLCCSSADAGVWGERETMVMAPPLMHDSAVPPCFHGCQVFLHRRFPRQPSPSHTLDLSVSRQSTAALSLRLLHNP